MRRSTGLVVLVTLATALVGTRQEVWSDNPAASGHGKHVMVTPDSVDWGKGPPSLPPGAQHALLDGDPHQAQPYTMRLKLPDGYHVPPHTHPVNEHVTVLKGALLMGMGEKADKADATELPAGSFFMLPKGDKHFVWAKGETIVQLHGNGPWGITYLNPEDDPRNARQARK